MFKIDISILVFFGVIYLFGGFFTLIAHGQHGYVTWKDFLVSLLWPISVPAILLWNIYDHFANFEKRELRRKVEKLKRLVLLTDSSVWHIKMNEIAMTQWKEFIREFPDEITMVNELFK